MNIIKSVLLLLLFTATKSNSQIQLQWVAIYNGPGLSDDYAGNMLLDGSNNLLVTGVSINDILTVKYSPLGQQTWESRYDGS